MWGGGGSGRGFCTGGGGQAPPNSWLCGQTTHASAPPPPHEPHGSKFGPKGPHTPSLCTELSAIVWQEIPFNEGGCMSCKIWHIHGVASELFGAGDIRLESLGPNKKKTIASVLRSPCC